MPSAEFFTEQGLFVVRDFLDTKLCAEICDEINKAVQLQTPLSDVANRVGALKAYPGRPKAAMDIGGDYQKYLKNKLSDLMPKLSEHFRVELKTLYDPYFAIYNKGDSLIPHVDSTGRAKQAGLPKERKLSVVIFLNEESPIKKKGAYSGGNLIFHGLLKDEKFGRFGIPLNSEAGMLIAFPSTILHEVSQITAGTRFVVNSGYY